MNDDRRARFCAALALGLALAAIGCGDDGNTNTSSNGDGGAGGAGGAGGGGAGGAGGAGGGNAVACLDPKTHAGMFTIKDASLCVVAFYEVDAIDGSPTWGRHGGPLTVSEGNEAGSVKITRLSPPASATGKLTAQSIEADAAIPAMTYLGAQAIDLPFFNWTAISYTATFPNTEGEVILLDGAKVAQRYPVNGFYAGAAVGAEGSLGRLLYTGLSPIGDANKAPNGLYAADACGAPGDMPRLVPDGDASCAAPIAVSTFGNGSGPVTVDRQGNAIVVLTNSMTSDQSARGFAAEKVARGGGAYDGDPLFTLAGFGGSIAAISPDADSAGVIAFQPFDGATYEALDVVGQKYRVTGGAMKAEGAPTALLELTIPGTGLSFFNDDQDRIWVSGPAASGGGVAFAVVARAPKP